MIKHAKVKQVTEQAWIVLHGTHVISDWLDKKGMENTFGFLQY